MNRLTINDASLIAMIHSGRLIVCGCVLGLLVFIFIASIAGENARSLEPILAFLAVAFAAQVTALRLFLPDLFVKSQVKALKDGGVRSIAGKLPGLFQTRLIIAMALLEGAALFNLIAYVLNGQWFSMATAAFMLVLIGMMFPTSHGYKKWVEDIERNMAA
jgi:hypothetical protein